MIVTANIMPTLQSASSTTSLDIRVITSGLDRITELSSSLTAALAQDRQLWAETSVLDNSFYQAPVDSEYATPGSLLKLERDTNTSLWRLPPGVSMSRIIYQTRTLAGQPIPASAAILWPYLPRPLFSSASISTANSHSSSSSCPSPPVPSTASYHLVAWAHGTSGLCAGNAPSRYRNLWNGQGGPFALVQQGYVVVAPDYAGQGVSRTAASSDGNRETRPITHEYIAMAAHADDIVYAVQAARRAFPSLQHSPWVVIGRSQGGGAAWRVAERQAEQCTMERSRGTDGYLGAVAISPVTDAMRMSEPVRSLLSAAAMVGMAAFYGSEFDLARIMTPEGIRRLDIIKETEAPTDILVDILKKDDAPLFRPGWMNDKYVKEYHSLSTVGGRRLKGPLLVIQGTKDDLVDIKVTADAIQNTRTVCPSEKLTFVELSGLNHSSAITSSQPIWMDWIAKQFARQESDIKSAPSRYLAAKI